MPWTLDDDAAEPLFRQALDLGITFWDTANVYGRGTSEEIVGRAIKQLTTPRRDRPRDQDLLAHARRTRRRVASRARRSSNRSTRRCERLGTDYVDLLQIHRFDPDVPVEETMEALHDVVKAGKARYLGASSMWAWRFAKMQHAAETHGWTRFISMQDQYSLLAREEEREMFGLLADQGVGSIPWSPLAAGKVTRPWGETGSTRAQANPDVDMFGRPLWLDSDKAIVDAVERIATERDVPMATSRWRGSCSNPVVDSPDRRRDQAAPPRRRRRRARHRAHRRRGRRARSALHAPRADLLLTHNDPR